MTKRVRRTFMTSAPIYYESARVVYAESPTAHLNRPILFLLTRDPILLTLFAESAYLWASILSKSAQRKILWTIESAFMDRRFDSPWASFM